MGCAGTDHFCPSPPAAVAVTGLCQPGASAWALTRAVSRGKAARSPAVFRELCLQHSLMIFGEQGMSLCTHQFPAMGDVPYQHPCLWVSILATLLGTHGARAGACMGLGQYRGDGRVDPWGLLAQWIWRGGLALAQHHPPQTCKAACYLCIPVCSHHVSLQTQD